VESVQAILDLAKGFGAAGPVIGMLVWLYWNERKERVELSAKVMAMSLQGIEASKDMTRALELLASKVTK
jgi:hypothetical protein